MVTENDSQREALGWPGSVRRQHRQAHDVAKVRNIDHHSAHLLLFICYVLTLCSWNSDMILVQDPAFKKIVELYVKDEDAFFKDFASAFSKLLELGVSFPAIKAWCKFW